MSIFEESQVYKPFIYQWAEDYRQESENMHWITDEVEMVKDVEDFKSASEDERTFIKNILSIFTQSDFKVGTFYQEKLIPHIKNNEIKGMLSSFACREYEHMRGYSHLNESLGLPESYFTDFLEHRETLAKNRYMSTTDSDNFGYLIAKQVLTEGISLFGSFTMLKNFERYGKYMGTCKINEWSLRDETLHIEGNAKLFRTWASENPTEIHNHFKHGLYEMAREIVKLEEDFIDFAFDSFTIEGITADEVKTYIQFMADRRLLQLGLKANYKVDNPLPWMDELSNGSSLQNFFEGKSSDYDVVGMVGEFRYD